MKKFVTAAVFMLMANSILNASCSYHSCMNAAQQMNNKAEEIVEEIYDKLTDKLNNDLRPAYKDYQKAVEKQNELLQKVQTLKRHNAILEKQIIFYRQQDKEVIGLSIDSISTKKGAEKP